MAYKEATVFGRVAVVAEGLGYPSKTYWVSTTGSSGNPGTYASPWSLDKALNTANGTQPVNPGDVIYFKEGEYVVSNTVNVHLSGDTDRPIVIEPDPDAPLYSVVVNCTAVISGGGGIVKPMGDWLKIGGFHIKQTETTQGRDPNTGTPWRGVGIYNPGNQFIWIYNNFIHDCGQGVTSYAPNDVFLWDNILVANGTNEQEHNIYAHSGDAATSGYIARLNWKELKGNVSLHAGGNGTQLWGMSAGMLAYWRVVGNIIGSHGQTTDPSSGYCDVSHAMSIGTGHAESYTGPIEIRDNVFYQNEYHSKATYTNKHRGLWVGVLSTYAYSGQVTITGNFGDDRNAHYCYNWETIVSNNNTWVINTTDVAYNATLGGYTLDTWSVDYNTYYDLNSGSDNLFRKNATLGSWATWQSSPALDAHGTINRPASQIMMGQFVKVVPNSSKPKRAHVAVVDYDALSSLNVDVSSFLAEGDPYAIYDCHNIPGGPVATGTVPAGGLVSFPLHGTAMMTLEVPMFTSESKFIHPAKFDAFLVVSQTSTTVKTSSAFAQITVTASVRTASWRGSLAYAQVKVLASAVPNAVRTRPAFAVIAVVAIVRVVRVYNRPVAAQIAVAAFVTTNSIYTRIAFAQVGVSGVVTGGAVKYRTAFAQIRVSGVVVGLNVVDTDLVDRNELVYGEFGLEGNSLGIEDTLYEWGPDKFGVLGGDDGIRGDSVRMLDLSRKYLTQMGVTGTHWESYANEASLIDPNAVATDSYLNARHTIMQAVRLDWGDALCTAALRDHLYLLWELRKNFWVSFDEEMSRECCTLVQCDASRKRFVTPTYPVGFYRYSDPDGHATREYHYMKVYVGGEPVSWSQNTYRFDPEIGLLVFDQAMPEGVFVTAKYLWRMYCQVREFSLSPVVRGGSYYRGQIVLEQARPTWPVERYEDRYYHDTE